MKRQIIQNAETAPISKQTPLNRTLMFATAVAALGGLLFGFDTAVIAGATHALTIYFRLTPTSLGLTVSSALWGTVVGCLFASVPSDRFGPRDSLRITGILYVVSALGCAFAHSWYIFLLFRVAGGVAIGGCSVFAPMYIAEISPAEIRGKLVGCFQLSIVSGILVAYASNFVLGTLHLEANEWRADLGVAAIPSILFFSALTLIPRSPRWLVRKGLLNEARQTLSAIGVEDAEAQVRRMATSFKAEEAEISASVFSRSGRQPMLLALALVFFNQMSGINAVLYYLNDIFAQAGFASVSAQKQAVAVGVANLAFTAVGMALIDRVGRKPLLLAGALGMATALGCIAAIFYRGFHQNLLLPLLMAFIAFFSASQGAVVWVYLSEIFPFRLRSSGQSIASFCLWVFTATITALFPLLRSRSGGLAFAIFSICMVVQFLTVKSLFPETRGRTLESRFF